MNNIKNTKKLEKKIKKFNIKKNNEITKILNINKTYNIDFSSNNKQKLIELYNDKELILKGEYNFFGIIQLSTNLWIWGTSLPGINKKDIININKLKSLNYLFESIDTPKAQFYYQLLSEDVLYIKSKKQIKWINYLLLYLSNDIYYFNPINSNSNIQFITLKNIIEKFI